MGGSFPPALLHSVQRESLPFYGQTVQTAGLRHPEYGGKTMYRNVGNYSPNGMAAHRRRLESSEKFYLCTKQSKSDRTESDSVLARALN
jgi:hypothetical protein